MMVSLLFLQLSFVHLHHRQNYRVLKTDMDLDEMQIKGIRKLETAELNLKMFISVYEKRKENVLENICVTAEARRIVSINQHNRLR